MSEEIKLAQRLYQLTNWRTGVWYVECEGSITMVHLHDKPSLEGITVLCPMYDLEYLLAKLPGELVKEVGVIILHNAERKSRHCAVEVRRNRRSNNWSVLYQGIRRATDVTPRLAALTLAVELIQRNIFKPEAA